MVLTMIYGCASNVKHESKPYNPSSSFAYNVMNISSPIPWDLKDANVAIPESYSSKDSWGFEVSQTLVGATKDMSSLGSVLSGGATMGLVSLALPKSQKTSKQPWTMMFVDANELEQGPGTLEENALKVFSDRVLNIIKDNYRAIDGNSGIQLNSGITFRDSWLLGHVYRLEFINTSTTSFPKRCKEKCPSLAHQNNLYLNGPFKTKISGVKNTNKEYYIISYRFMMNGHDPLKIYNFHSNFGEDLYFYHPAYTFDGRMSKGIPALLSKDGAHLFVKPKPKTLTQAQ